MPGAGHSRQHEDRDGRRFTCRNGGLNFSATGNALKLLSNSGIDLGGSGQLIFADSHAVPWICRVHSIASSIGVGTLEVAVARPNCCLALVA